MTRNKLTTILGVVLALACAARPALAQTQATATNAAQPSGAQDQSAAGNGARGEPIRSPSRWAAAATAEQQCDGDARRRRSRSWGAEQPACSSR